ECPVLMTADSAQAPGILFEDVGFSQEEVRSVSSNMRRRLGSSSRIDVACSPTVEGVQPINRIIEDSVVLDDAHGAARFQSVAAARPGNCVGEYIGRICVVGRAVDIEADLRAADVQQNLRRTGGLIWRDIDRSQ